MIQALILLKSISTNKEKKMEGGNMEGGNIAEVTETPTVIVFVSFLGNSTIKNRFGSQSSAYWFISICVSTVYKNNPVYPASAKAVAADSYDSSHDLKKKSNLLSSSSILFFCSLSSKSYQ